MPGMGESNERLREARIKAGFATATDAAKAYGWTLSTYLGHENGDRPISKKAAARYASAYGLDISILLYDQPPRPKRRGELHFDAERLVMMVGWLLHWRGLPQDEAETLARAVVEYASKPAAPNEAPLDRQSARIEVQAVMRMIAIPQRQ